MRLLFTSINTIGLVSQLCFKTKLAHITRLQRETVLVCTLPTGLFHGNQITDHTVVKWNPYHMEAFSSSSGSHTASNQWAEGVVQFVSSQSLTLTQHRPSRGSQIRECDRKID